MITKISNDQITFVSESRNVEPRMLRFNDEDVNYFWLPPGGEPLGAAICFPTLGTLPDFRYHLNGKWYHMDMHGFAKDFDYEVKAGTDSVVYELRDNSQTRAQYPYAFRFQVAYSVRGNEFITEYRVHNPNDTDLPFSVGGHPRFSCPMDVSSGLTFEDYYLEFESPECIENIIKSYGPVEKIAKYLSEDGLRLALNDEMFEKGCFCFSPFHSKRATLRSKRSTRSITMSAPTVTHFQLWKAVGEQFLALEPWYGSITSVPPREEECDWIARPGTIFLAPGEEFTCSYSVHIDR